MKKILAMFLALLMVLSLAACAGTKEPVEEPSSGETSGEVPEETGVHLERDDWADDVKAAVNDFVDLYGVNSEGYDAEAHPYVVFDFDNT